MAEFNVTASVSIHLDRDIEAKDHEEAEKEMKDYLDNSANIESDFFQHIQIMDYDIEDVNEI